MSEKITSRHLERRAILYVRQSSASQVVHHEESRRLQYAMRERLDALGWSDIEVIDDDLGRSASGSAHRSGFERMVAQVCLGQVGAVAAREASRFARNNPEWHQLVEVCAVVEALLIDHETVYDPRNSNDRLLLGLKGSMSVYELDQLRHRALAARRGKARRGELRLNLPAGLVSSENGSTEKEPDQRVQQAIELIFQKTLELGSARQAALWFVEHGLDLPVRYHDGNRWKTIWRRPTAPMVARMVSHPMYAGAYAYGKRRIVTQIEDGLPRRVTRCRPKGEYEVLIRDHHEAYICWEDFERIQQMLSRNAQQRGPTHGAAKAGKGLLVGLLRCARCGRKLRVTYTGRPRLVRYVCDRSQLSGDDGACISFGGTAVDEAVEQELLRVIEPGAIEAAAVAAAELEQRQEDWVEALALELESARYEALRAQRQYDSVDPENRLVASGLEARWNRALEKVAQLEKRIAQERDPGASSQASVDLPAMLALASDLAQTWGSPRVSMALKKRIARALVEEVIVDLPAERPEVELVIHWKGGVHVRLSVARRRRGQHGDATSKDTIDAVRVLALVCNDDRTAQMLNRSGLRTAKGLAWNRTRVKSVRHGHGIPVHDPSRQAEEGWLNLGDAAKHVGVAPLTLRRAIERGEVPALHPVHRGPWVVRRQDLDQPSVIQLFERVRGRRHGPGLPTSADQHPLFSSGFGDEAP